MEKIVLSQLSMQEIEDFICSLGISKYRAKQIYQWVYVKSVKSIDEMTDLPLKLREELKEKVQILSAKIKQRQISNDGTIKYLIEYADGACVETVLMRFDNRANLTACVSSQVGCPLKCAFCATGQRGFIRDLSYNEIIEQVLLIQADTGLKVTNIVFMGQGEPLLNIDNLLKAIEIFNNDFQIAKRRLTISTSGILPEIKKLADMEIQSPLAISLHAPTHELRESLMPIEKKYHIDELIKTLKYFTEKTGRRVTIEYILIDKLNSTEQHAKILADLIHPLKCNINLIVYNECDHTTYKKPSKENVLKFKYILEHAGKKVTVRLERGADIDAACGQLSGKQKI